MVQIKKIVKTLGAIGSPLTDEEHIDAIFDGLLEEYDGLISSCLTRSEPFTVPQIKASLMHQEERLEHHKQRDTTPIQAHTVHSQNQSRRGFPNTPCGRGPGILGNHARGCDDRYNPTFSTQGRGPKLQCQLCGRVAHSVFHCWYRFDENLTAPTLHATQSQNDDSNNHSAQAMLAASTNHIDDSWYPNTGATHHLTHDLGNLMVKNEYNGGDRVQVGDGTALTISHARHSSFYSKNPNIHFTLQNLLYVPDITKNLIYVSQFAKDNGVFFEFHSNKCVVKCQETQ